MVHLDQAGGGNDLTQVFGEHGTLEPFVEHYWVEDMMGTERPDLGSWRIVPDTSAHVLFHAYADGSSTLCLVGTRSIFTDIDKRRRLVTVGARLTPTALATLAGDSAGQFTDRSIQFADVLPQHAPGLQDQLSEAAVEHPLVAVGHLRRTLNAIFSKRRPSSKNHLATAATRGLAAAPGDSPVAALAHSLGVGPRSLRATMREHVGLSAKRFARIARVHRVIEDAQRGGRAWLEVALDNGYVDQPHLSRDFRDLLGESPTRFLRRAVPYKTVAEAVR